MGKGTGPGGHDERDQVAPVGRGMDVPTQGLVPTHGRNSPDDSWWLRHLSSLPEDSVAIIEPVDDASGHAGRARPGEWRLRFDPRNAPSRDFLTGWTGGEDPLVHLDMRFASRDAAEDYCKRIALRFVVHELPRRHTTPVNRQHFELEEPIRLHGWPDATGDGPQRAG